MNRPFSLALAAASVLVSTAVSSAAGAESFYQRKTITIIVGFTPGGGYDVYARILARYLPDHVPGHPTVIVQNQPGAGSLLAARSVVATQPKDGTVIVSFNAGLITQSIVQPEIVNLDLAKYAWIGAPTPDFRVCYGFGSNGVRSWSDMMSRSQFALGSEGKGSGDYINARTLQDVFGAPIKVVLGFPGSADARLAIERGELDGGCGALSSIPVDWIRGAKAFPFVRFTATSPPEMPKSAAFIDDFATTKSQTDLLDLLDAVDEVGRPFAISAEVPGDRIALLRSAFDATMRDPAFVSEAQKQQLPIYPLTGQQVEKIVTGISLVPSDIVARARKIYE